MQLTDEQQAILDFAKASKQSLLIEALAGAAKTTQLTLLAQALPPAPTLCVAFNKRIAEEMKKKMPGNVECATLNSLGHRAWGRMVGKRLTVDAKKNYKFVGDEINALASESERSAAFAKMSSLMQAVALAKTAGYVPQSCRQLGRSLVPDHEALLDIIDAQIDDLPTDSELRLIDRVLEKQIKASYNGVVDFDDQIYMSCQPAETQVAVRSLGGKFGYKSIDCIKAGDEVVSFDRRKGVFTGFYNHASKVLGVASRKYTGWLYTVGAGCHRTHATEEHKWLVRFVPELKRTGLYLTYLMLKGGSFRVGQTQIRSVRPGGTDGLGLAVRCALEKPECAWILGIHCSLQEAKIAEARLVARYGITDTCYNSEVGIPVHKMQREMVEHFGRGVKCLEDHGRNVKYPFWTPNATRAFHSNFITESCNLIPGLMQVPVLKEGDDPNWTCIDIASSFVQDLPVYSLKVARTELYVADNILTHNCLFGASFIRFYVLMVDEAQDFSPLNHEMLPKMLQPNGRLIAVGDPWQSIYAFRGADTNSMARLESTFNMHKMTLSTTFRVPVSGVKRAHSRVPHMRWWAEAIEGRVHHWDKWSASDVPEGAFVLCRNNAPLFACALRLIKAGRGVRIVGADIGPGLIKVMRKLGDQGAKQEEVHRLIDSWEQGQLEKARENRKASIIDRAECLRVFTDAGATLGEAVAWAEHLFASGGTIQLMTIHKSKGLEADYVVHLDPWRIPSKFAKRAADEGDDRQLQQELNLRYVGETRFKKELYLANLEDFA